MKVFRDRVSRDQITFLLVHAVLTVCLGLMILTVCYGYIKSPLGIALWRMVIHIVQSALLVLVGLALMLVSCIRLFRPFEARRMRFQMRGILVAEAIAIIFGVSMVMDGGQTASRILFGAVALNLFLITFCAEQAN